MDSGKVTSGSPRLAGLGEVTPAWSSWLLWSVVESAAGGSCPLSAVSTGVDFSFLSWRRLLRDGDLVVHLHEPESERARGVIGLGEPPVISGGAAISNAVCNATGIRVPVLPLTPKRVLDALRSAKG